MLFSLQSIDSIDSMDIQIHTLKTWHFLGDLQGQIGGMQLVIHEGASDVQTLVGSVESRFFFCIE